jgi:two-component system, chemotaxis family, chemotaxis protein CheY
MQPDFFDMKRILVVDDNAINRKLATALLKKRGWASVEVDSGAAALEALVAGDFDAVLLDIRMPGIDGEEVCRRIRADARWSDLCLVAYTAHALESEKQRFIDTGFDTVLIKPITMQNLVESLPD